MNENQYLKHELIYNIYNNKFTWCETCKAHHYDGIKKDGNVSTYYIHTLSELEKPKAVEIYLTLNNQ